jgi:hypothetical protein
VAGTEFSEVTIGLTCGRDREHAWGSHSLFSDASSSIKLSEHKSDHSFPSVSEVKTECLLHASAARYLYIRDTFHLSRNSVK